MLVPQSYVERHMFFFSSPNNRFCSEPILTFLAFLLLLICLFDEYFFIAFILLFLSTFVRSIFVGLKIFFLSELLYDWLKNGIDEHLYILNYQFIYICTLYNTQYTVQYIFIDGWNNNGKTTFANETCLFTKRHFPDELLYKIKMPVGRVQRIMSKINEKQHRCAG